MRILATLAAAGLMAGLMAAPAHAATPPAGGTYTLRVAASGKCIDVTGGGKSSGTLLEQWGCSAATGQQWAFNRQYTVAADGTGDYTTVQAAIDAVPASNPSRVVITIKPGTYRESTLSATVATGQPWTDMSGNTWQAARFSEYLDTGAGAGVNSNRPQLTAAQAASSTPQTYLAGTDGWNPT